MGMILYHDTMWPGEDYTHTEKILKSINKCPT